MPRPLHCLLIAASIFLGLSGCKDNPPAEASSAADLELVRAALKIDIDGVKAALKKGANPDASSDLLGKGPALVKLAREDIGFAKALIASGANVNASRKDGDTPLIIAAVVGNKEVIKLLLDKGADVNAKNLVGYTAISEAVHKGEAEVAQMLADKGADLNLGGGADGVHLPFDRALGKSDRARDVTAARSAIVKLILSKAKPDRKRLDMATEAVAAWKKTGPNICSIAHDLAAAGGEKTLAVTAFLKRCTDEQVPATGQPAK